MNSSTRTFWREGLQRFLPVLTLASCYVSVGAALRIALWAVFGRQQEVGVAALGWMLPAGAAADAVQCLYFLAPPALFLWLVPNRWLQSWAVKTAMLLSAFIGLFGMLFVTAIEYLFFEEFDARLNLIAVDYLMYPTEVIGGIRDSYPLMPVLIAVGATAAAVVIALRGRLLDTGVASSGFARRSAVFGVFALCALTAMLGFETHALARSDNRIANEIAANGASGFFRALRTNEIDYHTYYASRSPHDNLRDLAAQLAEDGGRFTDLERGRIDRAFAGDPKRFGKLNVVIVASESFGAEFSKLYGSARDWTPEFDAYARRGLWFRHMYASGTRTVRGLEAIVTSLPPIPSVSVLRRPGNEHIANLGSVMRANGYRTSFLYGGYGYFDNMNYFFSNNGFEVLDRRDIRRTPRFENVWGMSDEDLFDMALDHCDQLASQGRPFFSLIMTTSNHKPFTFRAGVPGVRPEGGGREAGVRYADFAQGYFLREAAKHAWFDNTLFVVVADHGARVYGREDIPLKTYEIPMLFYAPKHVRPGVVDALTTQIDIAPTVLSLLGLPYRAPFFGQDVLNVPAQQRVAVFNHNYEVALYKNGKLAILGLGKSVRNVVYDRNTDSYRPAPADATLNDLAVAYYQTASELFHSHQYN